MDSIPAAVLLSGIAGTPALRHSGTGFPNGTLTRHEMRHGAMPDSSLKADAETDRLVSDLAYLLGATKKQVLAEAVAAYAAPRLPAGRERGPFTDLPVRQRLALRRDELLRAFDRHGASELRLLGPLAKGEDVDLVEILAETNIMMGGEAAGLLAGLAREILATRVEVISARGPAFSNPELLRRLRAESVPL